MRVGIACFSGTGNTWHIAQQYADALTASGHEATCVRLEQLLDGDLQAWRQGKDLLGLGHPVHGFGEPRIVGQFIERLGCGEGQRIFLFTTSAGGEGRIHARMRKRLTDLGYDVVGEAKFHPRCDYFFYKSHRAQTPEQIERRFATFEGAIEAHVAQMLAGEKALVAPQLIEWLLPNRLLSALYKLGCRRGARYFRVSETCTQCGLCVRFCPTHNIAAQGDTLVFGNACTMCLRCMAICPMEAISSGPIRKGAGIYMTPGLRQELRAQDADPEQGRTLHTY